MNGESFDFVTGMSAISAQGSVPFLGGGGQGRWGGGERGGGVDDPYKVTLICVEILLRRWGGGGQNTK